jgi:hypothetical protein
MLINRFLKATLVVGILASSVMPTTSIAGTVVYNNLGNFGGIYGFGITNGSQSNSFTSSSSAALLDVTITLLKNGNSTGGTLTVNLVNDVGNNTPDLVNPVVGVLGTLSEDQLATTLTAYPFSSFAPITLAGGTRYWINVVSSVGTNSNSYWGYAADNTGVGTALEFNSNPVDGTAPNGAPYQMEVRVVPEPATLALFSVGLVGIGFGKRRKVS